MFFQSADLRVIWLTVTGWGMTTMGTLNVSVTYPGGHGEKDAKVIGEAGGFIGGMTESVHTDVDGHAAVTLSSSISSLAAIYVDGKKHRGPFECGETYAFPG